MEKTTITLEIETWKKLSKFKIDKEFQSFDEVINFFLNKHQGGKKNE